MCTFTELAYYLEQEPTRTRSLEQGHDTWYVHKLKGSNLQTNRDQKNSYNLHLIVF